MLVPGALPSIFTGLRLSLQASWTTLVAAELVGAVAGLGTILNQAAQDIYPAMILVGMVSVALCGWLMTLGLGWIERRVHAVEGLDDREPRAAPRRASGGCPPPAPRASSRCGRGRAGGHHLARVPAGAVGRDASASAQLLVEPFAGYTLHEHLLSSLQRFGMGFVLAVVVGIPLGLLMAWFRWVDRIVSAGLRGRALRRADRLGAVRRAVVRHRHRRAGADHLHGRLSAGADQHLPRRQAGRPQVHRSLADAGRERSAAMTEVLLPAAVPSIVAGLRISAGLGWQSLVGAELIVASSGVGYMMVQGPGGNVARRR